MTLPISEIEGLTGLQHVEGYVWCDKEGSIHSDTLNPNGYVEDGEQDYCLPINHRPVFMDNDDSVPVPASSAPVEPKRRKILTINPPLTLSTFTALLDALAVQFPNAYMISEHEAFHVYMDTPA